jgi:dTDP-glucose 4,6-dehydratase
VKNVLITGGAGFIGSHLCQRLLKEDFRVICMDNLITGKMENISDFLKNPHFQFIEHDVSKYIDIKDRLDFILHFAFRL